MKLAPIVIFVYNRPRHAQLMLESLTANPEFSESAVFIYCDGPRTDKDREKVKATSDVIDTFATENITVIRSEINKGLANSIISGVTEICNKYGKVIVIEDDLILSPFFLRYMNEALDKYEQAEQVISISGYNFPLKTPAPETFFFRTPSSWGWATWKRAWKFFEPDSKTLISRMNAQPERISDFNHDNTIDYWGMLNRQAEGKIDSWGIRWDASVFLNGGLTLYPGKSLVDNIGHDASGRHCGVNDDFKVSLLDRPISQFPTEITENSEVFEAMKGFNKTLKKNLFQRIKRKLKGLFAKFVN